MPGDPPPSRTYRFGDSDRAAERLRLLAEVFEPSTRAFLRQLASRRPRRIADLGCGPGYTTRLLAEIFSEATVHGLDSSASFVALAARSPHPRVSYSDADVTKDLPGERYDLIYARYLLTHVPDYGAAIGLWRTRLVPEGAIAIKENEWIQTHEPAFAKYLAVVAAMLAAGRQKLYVGAELDAIERWPGLVKVGSELVPIEVSASATAAMFLLNLACWRDQEFIREQHEASEIDNLQHDLETLAGCQDTCPAITFGRRRLTLVRKC